MSSTSRGRRLIPRRVLARLVDGVIVVAIAVAVATGIARIAPSSDGTGPAIIGAFAGCSILVAVEVVGTHIRGTGFGKAISGIRVVRDQGPGNLSVVDSVKRAGMLAVSCLFFPLGLIILTSMIVSAHGRGLHDVIGHSDVELADRHGGRRP